MEQKPEGLFPGIICLPEQTEEACVPNTRQGAGRSELETELKARALGAIVGFVCFVVFCFVWFLAYLTSLCTSKFAALLRVSDAI